MPDVPNKDGFRTGEPHGTAGASQQGNADKDGKTGGLSAIDAFDGEH